MKLNSFSESEQKPNSLSTKLIEAAEQTNDLTLPTDQGLQLWRFFETKDYKKIRESQEFIERYLILQ